MPVRSVRIFFLASALILSSSLPNAQQQTNPPAAKPQNLYESTYKALPARTTLIRNATILTAAGPAIEGGSVLLQNGKVAAVGATVNAPADAVVIDGTGKWVTPGIIDTHSHLGVYAAPGIASLSDGNEMTNPVTAEVWADHSIWPQDPQFELSLAGGVTTMQILPGSGNLIGGRGVTVKNVPSRTTEGMKFPGAPAGLKMACGENPRRVYGQRNQMPSTRMGNIAVFRRTWQSAVDYRDKWKKWRDEGADPTKRPDRNLQMETLAAALDGEILVHIHCYRADEMATMIQLAKEFGFKISSFHHGVEAYKVRDLLVANNICASLWADWWGFKLEAYDGIRENIALVNEVKGCAIVHSDDPNGEQRLNQEAAKAMRAGLEAGMKIERADAVRWLTINPARALGIDHVTGSLEPGKNADVVIWNGDPFSVYAKAERVLIDGAEVYDRSKGLAQRDFMTGLESRPEADSSRPSRSPLPAAAPAPSLAPKQPNTFGSGASSSRLRPGPVASTSRPDSVAVTNGRIFTVSGAVIEKGTIVIAGGKIIAIGADVEVPAGAKVIDATNKIITPGWIESATSIGIVEISSGAEGTDDQATTEKDLSAAFNVVDAFNPLSTVIPVTRVEGITRAVVAPAATGNVILGQAAMFDLAGDQVPASVTRAPVAMFAALGEAGADLAGGSRVAAVLRLREMLQDAVDFNRNRVAWNAAQRRPYARGRLDLEALEASDPRRDPAGHRGQSRQRSACGDSAGRRIQAETGPDGSRRRLARGAGARAPEHPRRGQAANRHPDLRRARRLARECRAAPESWGDADPVVVRYAQRAQPATGGRQRDLLRTGSQRCAACGHSDARSDLGRRRENRVPRSRQGRRPGRLVRRSVRADHRAEHVFIGGREMSKDTRQKALFEKYRTLSR